MSIENKINSPDHLKDSDRDIRLFEANGYKNIQRILEKSSNHIFTGQKNEQECFIKKFLDQEEADGEAGRKISAELACYKNLPAENLIDVVEVNLEEKYLVLEQVKLENIEKNEKSIKNIIDLYFNKLVKNDTQFLPSIQWAQYEKLFKKFKVLENHGLINGADKFINMFNERRELINESKKVFSHHDFNFSNIKNVNGRLVIYDFEHAAWDNAMYDPATFYIEMQGDDNLKQVTKNLIQDSYLFNQELFDLMLIRRCVDVMYGLKDRKTIPYFQKNKLVLDNLQLNWQ